MRNVSTKLRHLGSAISGATDLQGGRRQRVDPYRWGRSEDLRLAADETFGMGVEGSLKHGLTPGQKIVVAGQYRLQVGSVVQPSEVSGSSALAKEADNRPKAP